MFQDVLLFDLFQRTYLILLFSSKSIQKFPRQNLPVRKKAHCPPWRSNQSACAMTWKQAHPYNKGHITRGNFPCKLQRNGVALQVARKTSSCDTPCLQLVSQRKIALQVAEKVEAASTFRNATRQVAAYDMGGCVIDTPTAIRHNQNAADIFKYWAGVKYNLTRQKLHCKLQGQIASCDMALNVYINFLLTESAVSSISPMSS